MRSVVWCVGNIVSAIRSVLLAHSVFARKKKKVIVFAIVGMANLMVRRFGAESDASLGDVPKPVFGFEPLLHSVDVTLARASNHYFVSGEGRFHLGDSLGRSLS